MQVFFILFSVHFAVYQYINSKCLYRTHVNLILWVGVAHFLCSKRSKCSNFFSKCILAHFATHFGIFCNSLSRAKAVPLHRISKRAETANK